MNRTPLLAVAAAFGLTAIAGCGGQAGASVKAHTSATAAAPPARTSGPGPVAVKLTEWAVTPSVATVTHGKVSLDVTNAGRLTHELVVLRTAKPAAALGHGARIKESGHVGETGDLPVGSSKTVSLTLKPGHYSLVCNLPGHYMSGMRADLTVR